MTRSKATPYSREFCTSFLVKTIAGFVLQKRHTTTHSYHIENVGYSRMRSWLQCSRKNKERATWQSELVLPH